MAKQTKSAVNLVNFGRSESATLLRVEDLKLYFRTTKGVVQAVDGVSFELGRRRSATVLGESGCGKTTLARAILRLLPRNVHTFSGKIVLDGVDLMPMNDEWFRKEIRWRKISFVPQAAMNALNPVLRVGHQIAEPLVVHHGVSQDAAFKRAVEAAKLVGLPEDFLSRYAFELSGGMRQRAIIAMALLTNPELIILDEPTSALDVLTQANIMNTLKKIKREFEMSYILITHDIATSSELADEVIVMYAGHIVEHSPAARFFKAPLHPYAQKLMASVPTLREDKELEFIPGQPPSLLNPPKGCRFAPRCPKRFERCAEEPPLFSLDGVSVVKCWLFAR
jgi:oligopeptide/dipeptide ABC transporter ATP-binding protein